MAARRPRVRPERPGDEATVREVVRRTYADVPFSDHREHLMVDRLRGTDAFLPALSLLAEVGGDVVGHVLLTVASVVPDDGGAGTPTLALAPLSVVPGARGIGVGSALVRAALVRAADLGHGSVVLVGIPDWYDRFGFRPLTEHPITLPFDAPAAVSKILELRPGALDGVHGTVRYAEGWLDH